MSREIKFRYWNGQQMHEIRLGDEWWDMPKDIHFMQYTGLKDKNGKEIYEGDILKCSRDYWGEERKNRVVEWDEVDAGFYLLNKKDPVDSETFDRTSSFLVREDEREIIGNIYENPELAQK